MWLCVSPTSSLALESESRICIFADGRIYFRGKPVQIDELSRVLNGLSESQRSQVTVEADSAARYDKIDRVLDAMRNAKMARVGFKSLDAGDKGAPCNKLR
jgi:biopolymer transport protein ExbD